LSLTVFSNCVSGSSNIDTAFLLDYTKFVSVIFRISNWKFNEDSKNVLKTVIFLLQVGFTGDFFRTAFFLKCTNFLNVFFRFTDRKFNEDSKNMLKTIIFLLQVVFTSDFVPDCSFKLCFWQFKL